MRARLGCEKMDSRTALKAGTTLRFKMCIRDRDTGYHVNLGMACIALGGFQIAVVQFQFVGGTGMTERVKDHLRQPCVLTELCKLFEDDPILSLIHI